MKRLIILTVLIAHLAAVACDDTDPPQDRPDPTTADDSAQPTADDIREACYHFEVNGSVEDSATCLSHSTEEGDDGELTIELIGQHTTVALNMPRNVTTEQYPISATADQKAATATVTPDGDLPPTYTASKGTLTVMHVDDEAISALFDFEAASDTDDTDAISVRGHLRDLERSP